MLYLVHSKFKPITAEIEALMAKWQPQHRAFVDSFADQILVRGPTLDEKGVRTNNYMIAEFADRAAVDAFIANEPLTKAGLFSSVTVERFDKRYPKD